MLVGCGSLHASSAVNANDLAIDPLAVLRSEEADDAGDVDRLADTLHWRPSFGVLRRRSTFQLPRLGK